MNLAFREFERGAKDILLQNFFGNVLVRSFFGYFLFNRYFGAYA